MGKKKIIIKRNNTITIRSSVVKRKTLIIRKKKPNKNNKVYRWKRKKLTRHDLVAEQRVGLPSDLAPKKPTNYVILDLENDMFRS